MRQSQGYDTLIAFGKEATQGTAPAAGVFKSWGVVTDFEPEQNKNHEPIRGLGSRTVQINKALNLEITSSLTMLLQDPKILYYALGKVTKTGAANAWVHTINPVGRCEELPTFTISENTCVNGSAVINQYIGSKIDTLTISGSAGEAIEVEADIISTKFDDQVPAASSYDTILNEPLTFADGTVTINGVSVSSVTEFDLEIANNLEAIYTISKGNNASFINDGILDVTGSLTFALTDTTQRTLFKNGTEFNVTLRFDDPVVPANYISIALTGAKYDTETIGKSSDDAVELELDVLFRNISITAGSKDVSDLTV